MRKRMLVIVVALAVALTFTCGDVLAVSTKTQKGNALGSYKVKNYKKVKGPKWAFVKQPKYKRWDGSYLKSVMNTAGGKANFRRWLLMDMDNPQSMTMTPDGKYLFIIMARSHSKNPNGKGHILKIDLAGINKDPKAKAEIRENGSLSSDVCSNGSNPRKAGKPYKETYWVNAKGKEIEEWELDDIIWGEADRVLEEDQAKDEAEIQRVKEELMQQHSDWDFYDEEYYDEEKEEYIEYSSLIVSAVNYQDPGKPYADNFDRAAWLKANGYTKKSRTVDEDYLYRKYIRSSKMMKVGHGQTLAYDAKAKKLWYFPAMTKKKGMAVMVNPDTLKQEKIIKFKMKSSVPCPSTLTFDTNGNAYCWSRARGGWGGKNVAKVYKGKITASGIHFNLVLSGINPAPGERVQGMGYNPKNKRLYLISDSSIVSVPTSRLSTKKSILRSSDIRATVFPKNKEFEDICFDRKGNGYFLTNKPDEIMKVNAGF